MRNEPGEEKHSAKGTLEQTPLHPHISNRHFPAIVASGFRSRARVRDYFDKRNSFSHLKMHFLYLSLRKESSSRKENVK